MNQKGESMNNNQERNTRINRFVVIFLTVINLILTGGYLQELGKGNMSPRYIQFLVIVFVSTTVLNWIMYLKDKSSYAFRHITVIGYGVNYALALFGASNDMVFTYAFPCIMVYILYFDSFLFRNSAIVLNLVNIIAVVRFFLQGAFPSGTKASISLAMIQVCSVAVTTIISCYMIKANNRMAEEHLARINEEREKTNTLLANVLQVAAVVKENSENANEIVGEWNETSLAVTQMLDDIAEGNIRNAESIDKQTTMTEGIQSMIGTAKDNSQAMREVANQGMEVVCQGKTSITDLKQKAEQIEEANRKVIKSMVTLINNANEVEEITKAIFNISSQTNLLALNASIESARAGEAGRGFAVVAEEIRVLADQTRTLTENIKTIVTSLQANADTAQNVVEDVIHATEEEKQLIDIAERNFKVIEGNMNSLNVNVENIYEEVEKILSSNNEIVNSIASISEVSNEVAAATQQAVAIGQQNKEKAILTQQLMAELMQEAERLNKNNESEE